MMAAFMETNFEQTGGDPRIHASPPSNAPRAPAAFRGRGRGFGQSYYSNRGSGRGRDRGRGRGRVATRAFNNAHSSALDSGGFSINSRAEFPVIGETDLGHQPQTVCSSSAASTVGVASEVSKQESRTITPLVGIPQGPAWNPPKGPRKYMMYQNQPRTQRTRTFSSSSSMNHASDRFTPHAEGQVAGEDEKKNLKTYSAVVAGLNKGLRAKVEASDGSEHIQRGSMGDGSDKEGEMVVRSSSGASSKKSLTVGEEVEKQVTAPLAYRDTKHSDISFKRPSTTAERPENELVNFSSSVGRPGWVRTTDEFMVLEFGSAGPITLRRGGPS